MFFGMVHLRPLIVVTGTIRLDGGETGRVRKRPGSTRRTSNRDGDTVVVVREIQITDDRRGGDTVATGYARRLTRMCLLRTPFGALCDPKDLPRVKDIFFMRATQDVAAFNKTHTNTVLSNCYVWEELAGNRLEAVRGWIDRQVRDGDEKVIEVLPRLRVASLRAAG